MLIDVIALGIVIPVLPKLIESMLGGNTPRAAEIFGFFGTAWALMQFVFSPVLGALSDRFGRRPVLLISMTGHGLDYILMALAPNLAWLFVGRIVSGITAASFSTAYAYIADVTPAEKRAAPSAWSAPRSASASCWGPRIGGLLGTIDPRLPFWVAAAFSLANAAYGYFVLPESLPRERRMGFSWARANPVGSLRLLAQHPALLGMAGVAFLYHLAHVVLPSVAVLYASYRYGFDDMTMGLTLAAVGVASGHRAGLPHQAHRRPLRRARVPDRGAAVRRGGLCHLRARHHQPRLLVGHPRDGAVGHRRRRIDGHHEPPRRRLRAGPAAGRQCLADGARRPARPRPLHAGVRARDRADTAWQLPGAPFLLAAAMLLAAAALSWRVTRPAT